MLLRRLWRMPAFTVTAVLTLALGIGATTAIFTVVNGVLLKPLPYPEPEQLVRIAHAAPGAGIDDLGSSPTMLFSYLDEGRTFREMGLWGRGTATVTGRATPERVRTLRVTAGVLPALGVQPMAGRWFSVADDSPDTPETVILTGTYWQRAFGADPAVIGDTITVDERPRIVIGIMPPAFRFLDVDADLIVPMRWNRAELVLGNLGIESLARLNPGATLDEARADIARMLPVWLRAWPPPPSMGRAIFENSGFRPIVQPLKAQVVGDVGRVLWVLLGTIGMVLLIACANVANLLLVRVEGRQQELATRMALGASRRRLARDLLQESLVISVLGGAIGVALAYGAVQVLRALAPGSVPRLADIAVDPVVLVFALGVSVVSGLLFGSVPLLRRDLRDPPAVVHGSARGATQGRERLRVRNVLVVAQVALALVLLTGSGLMLRTFQALRQVDAGFTGATDVQLVRVTIPQSLVEDPERVVRMQNDMLDRMAALPGVSAASFASLAPLEGGSSNDPVFAEDRVYAADEIPPIRRHKFIAPGTFETLGIPVVAGRDIGWGDVYEDTQVTIVSENLAREMWGSATDALGKRIRIGSADPWRQIVGVVGDVRDDGIDRPDPAIVYWPVLMPRFYGSTNVQRSVVFMLRSDRAGTEGLLEGMREAVWAVNPALPLSEVRTLDKLRAASMARTSFTVVMLGLAGALALCLGLVGLYGVISYTVSQRTREIGIRMALGESRGGIRRRFVGYALVLTGAGIVVGLIGATGAMRLLSSLLFEVSSVDPLTYGAVAASLLLAAVLAAYLPARRGAALDPVDALRTE